MLLERVISRKFHRPKPFVHVTLFRAKLTLSRHHHGHFYCSAGLLSARLFSIGGHRPALQRAAGIVPEVGISDAERRTLGVFFPSAAGLRSASPKYIPPASDRCDSIS
jgi:hypothetical protein